MSVARCSCGNYLTEHDLLVSYAPSGFVRCFTCRPYGWDWEHGDRERVEAGVRANAVPVHTQTTTSNPPPNPREVDGA